MPAFTAERPPRSARARTIAIEVALVAGSALVELGATAVAAGHQSRGDLGAAGIALLAAGIAVLPLRRRFPIGVLAATLATTLAYWSLGYPRGPIFVALVVAFGYVVLRGLRAAAVTSLVIGFLTFPWLGYLIGRGKAPQLHVVGALAAWLLVLLTVAELIRSRRERAREAERSRVESAQRRASEERLRIAQELHDVVAHSMSLINLRAGIALHLMDQDPQQARAALTTIKDVSKVGLVELRSILGVLRQAGGPDDGAPRMPTPSLDQLDVLVDRARTSGVRVRLDADPDLGALPSNVDLAAYRIVQESLTNVARHGERPEADVRLHRDGDALEIRIVNAGSRQRMTRHATDGGSGIVGMRERAASVGGVLDAGPRADGTFEVRARLPVTPGS
ncbi:MAG TPA: histidine kinase [Acidimicrobiia bacterium]|nr:histidine kinase [Acidimicrobiia bacterium]